MDEFLKLGLRPPVVRARVSSSLAPALITEAATRVANEMALFLQHKLSEPYPPASIPLVEYPKKRSGTLMSSIVSVVRRVGLLTWQIEITSPLDYATYLQTGTRRRRRMLPRPFYNFLLRDYGLDRIAREFHRSLATRGILQLITERMFGGFSK